MRLQTDGAVGAACVAVGHRVAASTVPLAVLGQEGLLERRLAADEVGELVARGGAHDGRDAAGNAHVQHVVLGDDVATRRAGAELLQRHLVGEDSSTWWWARSRSASVRSTRASRPSRMIATRSQVFSTSERMCDDRNTVRPSALASRMTA